MRRIEASFDESKLVLDRGEQAVKDAKMELRLDNIEKKLDEHMATEE